MQGAGVTGAASARYKGAAGDISGKVTYNGGGVDNGQNALSVFLADDIMTCTPFAVVWHDGRLVQLNRNGQPELLLSDAVSALNNAMFYRVYQKSDFNA